MQRHYPLNPSTGIEDASLLPWTNGNPTTGTEGSYPPFGLFTDPQEEILHAAGGTGQTAGSDLTQLLQAISRGIYFGSFGGTANALAATIPNGVVVPALTQGMAFSGFVASANTGPVTMTMTGFTAAPGTLNVVRNSGSALSPGDLQAGQFVRLVFDGTNFRIGGLTPSDIAALFPTRTIASWVSTGTYYWTCPAGVTRVHARVWGAGGGGSGGGNAAGCGGGYAEGWYNVVPGTTYTITVGIGGIGNSGTTTGGTGASSSFASFASATGGAGGTSGPGVPGTGTGGQINLTGGRGEDLESANYYAQGGASPFGGIGYYQGAMSPGGGGSATATGAVIGAGGYNGADGAVILDW